MKCCGAHGLEELWSCSDEWNVIGQAALLSEVNHKTNQMLMLLRYVWIYMYVFISVVALIELKRLLLSCASVLRTTSERWLVFAEAEMGTETCAFSCWGYFQHLRSRGQDSLSECQWHFRSLCLPVCLSFCLSLSFLDKQQAVVIY